MVKNSLKAHLFILSANIIYGINYSIGKIVLEHIPPFGIVLMRVTGALLIFFLLHSIFIKEKVEKKDQKKIFFAALFGDSASHRTPPLCRPLRWRPRRHVGGGDSRRGARPVVPLRRGRPIRAADRLSAHPQPPPHQWTAVVDGRPGVDQQRRAPGDRRGADRVEGGPHGERVGGGARPWCDRHRRRLVDPGGPGPGPSRRRDRVGDRCDGGGRRAGPSAGPAGRRRPLGAAREYGRSGVAQRRGAGRGDDRRARRGTVPHRFGAHRRRRGPPRSAGVADRRCRLPPAKDAVRLCHRPLGRPTRRRRAG